MRYLAIDYGSKRVGLAICDESETISSPLAVIAGRVDVFVEIGKVVRAEGVGAVVVGLPLNMDGSEGPQADEIRNFGARLAKYIKIEVLFHDERLTSFAAEEKFASVEPRRSKKRRSLDAVAAAAILESFLESRGR